MSSERRGRLTKFLSSRGEKASTFRGSLPYGENPIKVGVAGTVKEGKGNDTDETKERIVGREKRPR